MISHDYFRRIEELIGEDIGGRGLGKALRYGDLKNTVEELNVAKKVMVVTGFCIKDSMTGETDGPMGAVSLANGLIQLDKGVVIVTDEFSVDLVGACCKVLDLNIKIEVVPYLEADGFCKRLIKEYNPTHVVALERPGKGKDGGIYSMRGEDLSGFIPSTDALFWEAHRRGIKTIAIGDGGNEMGMGKIAPFIAEYVNLGNKICAETVSDFLIIAGISNWGGHGIVAALSILNSKLLLHSPREELKMLEAMVSEGAVDGCSKKSQCTVDGLSLEINLEILEKLHKIVEEYYSEKEKIVS